MQLVTCQCLTADSGVANLMPALSNSFVEIDQQIISTDILLPSADCQLQATVCELTIRNNVRLGELTVLT